jgi:hypothetical protein
MNALDASLAALLRGDGHWPDNADPQAFLRRAQWHGVGALLHEAGGRNSPPALRDALRDDAMRAAAAELLWRRELERLLRVLSAGGVVPVVLKGTALAYTLYPAPHLRPRIDLDLLVPLAAREHAARALEQAGYAGSLASAGRFVRTQAEFQRAREPGLIVDLHWRISTTPMFTRSLGYELLRARAVACPSPQMLVPCPVDALLHACAHRAARIPVYGTDADPGDRLIWLMDIRVLAEALDGARWSEFAGLARKHGLCGICLSGLEAARAALGAPVPEAILGSLREGAARPEPSAALLGGDRWKILAGELRSLPDLGQRVRYLIERTLPPSAYVREKYQSMARWPLPALYARHLTEGLRRRG